ncbi:MAG: DNA topoisomerase I [Bacteroidetes bacterium GWA2_31_9]|nr:MAG: DNA topoisomerase I [Bacteroidetes bacterium GWA2_31_9]
MEENLVIVESPAKAKTIQTFLGKDFLVKSCFGHIRDLSKKENGIKIDKNYEPIYEVPADKKKLVTELTKYAKEAKVVWLASDEDREGEAISWHLCEALKIPQEKTQRIVFHEITKEAIKKAVANPRKINKDLVDAQQARRILDRLVGFELSPLLWKKIKPALSAGRVQSVSVRLIVEREKEIQVFNSTSSYRVIAIFTVSTDKAKKEFKAELNTKFTSKDDAKNFLEKCKDSIFNVDDVVTQPSKKSPAPPFTTSTLQQEAGRKLGFSVSQTMTVAQKLYEAGHITYMRTDSLNLAESAVAAALSEIKSSFGENYAHKRTFVTKSKGAQEAHEAIRPTYLSNKNITGPSNEQRLYDLIWKRTLASQMSDAKFEKTTANINISNQKEKFVASGEVLKFDGFLKVYLESTDEEKEENDETLLPELLKGAELNCKKITATEKYTHYPARYTEASLVKKMEDLGIGRPSTYAPTISTIQNRGYVIKEDRTGVDRNYNMLTLTGKSLKEEVKTETAGKEKSKLFPTDIGIVVNDFLVEYFADILDYNFTASVEAEFDEIAEGKLQWQKMIDKFYKPFHAKVDNTQTVSEKAKGERILGEDPNGKTVYAKIGRYGPMIQIGENNEEEKPKFASLLKGQLIQTITLEEALSLFKLPREVGTYNDKIVTIGIGRFGPYAKYDGGFYSLGKEDDPMTITIERTIEIIIEKIDKASKKTIKEFPENKELKVLAGRWGAYISYKKKNFKIPKDLKAEEITYSQCLELVGEKVK